MADASGRLPLTTAVSRYHKRLQLMDSITIVPRGVTVQQLRIVYRISFDDEDKCNTKLSYRKQTARIIVRSSVHLHHHHHHHQNDEQPRFIQLPASLVLV